MMFENDVLRWEERYKHEKPEEMPWYNQDLDHDFARVIQEYVLHNGKVLDVGTGRLSEKYAPAANPV